jgi:hypothetical protein
MPLFGPELWKTTKNVPFTTWDLWLMVLAVTGDEIGLDGVETKLVERTRDPGGFARDDAEAKLSQLDDLRARLTALNLEPGAVALKEARNPKIVAKARTKILEQTVPERDYTDAMRETPRVKLERRARTGHWKDFPVSPEKYAGDLLSIVEARSHYNESQAISLGWRLASRWEKLTKKATKEPAEALALHRAMLLVCLRAQDRANDSCGQVGMVFSDAIGKYAAVPWEKTSIRPEVYVRDAVEFATWEDYGQSDELEAIFAKLDRRHGDLAVRVLHETVAELERHGLFQYEVEQALAFKAVLLIAHGRFDEFVPLATKLGSSAWRPIVTMAEAAMKAKKPDLALAVFGEANQPGMHQKYLAEECRRVTRKKVPTAGLRVVK